jgi:ferritin-like metal-binding protein YciE
MAIDTSTQELLEGTLRELFQAESSATRHPRVEADRLGANSPGDAMEEIALHADSQIERLDELARARGLAPAPAAKGIGRALSVMRNNFADLATTSEQSYRFTMLGVRHGIDLVRMLRQLAVRADDAELKAWSEQWITRRLELIERAEDELAWFADNASRAMEPARATPLAAIARSALKVFGKLDTARANVRTG